MCTQAWRGDPLGGGRQEEESRDAHANPTTCSLFKGGRRRSYVYANLYFTLEMDEGGEEKKKKGCDGASLKEDKTNRSSATHVVSSL